MEEILHETIMILYSLDRKIIECIYEEIIQLEKSQLVAINALFSYFETEESFSYQTLLDVISDKLEFIPDMTLEEVAQSECYVISIPSNHLNISYYKDYKPTAQELSVYYFESNFGVLQIEHEEL